MEDNLKSDFHAELSALMHRYEDHGLDPVEMADALNLQTEVALSRSDPDGTM